MPRGAAERAVQVPVLWHLKVSSSNEKARWALDYKRVPLVRRAVQAGAHRPVAERLTGGRTLPVLELDGEAIGDSTRIIGALEQRFPDQPLYPSDPDDRRRALELEDYFDEQLGPYVRLLVMDAMLPDPGLMMGAFTPDLGRTRRLLAHAAFGRIRRRVKREFGIDAESVEHAYGRIRAAGERLRGELQSSGYLVDGGFSVADLALAALVAPAVAPVQFPYPQPQRGHPRLAPLREALAEAGIAEFALEMYGRHRGVSAELQS